MSEIISKTEARNKGLIHYFTGKLCVHGHIALRYVISGRCSECDRFRGKQNIEQVKKASREWNRRNKERMVEYKKGYYSISENKEQFLAKCKEYRNTHKAKYAAHCRTRQALQLNATPGWLTKEDLKEIELLYEKAQRLTEQTGNEYVVDHFYPLQGESVCGLHCASNLRVITRKENAQKHNKHPTFANNKT